MEYRDAINDLPEEKEYYIEYFDQSHLKITGQDMGWYADSEIESNRFEERGN